MTVALNSPDIQTIIAEIQRRFPHYVAGETVKEIQLLELKNGKVNYIFRYADAYFTIFWDSATRRIIFLNEVNTVSRKEFGALVDTELFKSGLAYISTYHTSEMKKYQILSSGQFYDGKTVVFML